MTGRFGSILMLLAALVGPVPVASATEATPCPDPASWQTGTVDAVRGVELDGVSSAVDLRPATDEARRAVTQAVNRCLAAVIGRFVAAEVATPP
jgi:hypothetical protein